MMMTSYPKHYLHYCFKHSYSFLIYYSCLCVHVYIGHGHKVRRPQGRWTLGTRAVVNVLNEKSSVSKACYCTKLKEVSGYLLVSCCHTNYVWSNNSSTCISEMKVASDFQQSATWRLMNALSCNSLNRKSRSTRSYSFSQICSHMWQYLRKPGMWDKHTLHVLKGIVSRYKT